ncbi:hypothetical protein Tco_1290932, partial [Tanacetum coccineum]
MAEQYDLDRKAKMQVLSQESEDRRRLIQAQKIAEDMKVLQIDTSGMDSTYAAIINAQKERIRAEYLPPNYYFQYDIASTVILPAAAQTFSDETWDSRDVFAEIVFSSGNSELHVSVLCVVAAVTTLCATTSIRSCGWLPARTSMSVLIASSISPA